MPREPLAPSRLLQLEPYLHLLFLLVSAAGATLVLWTGSGGYLMLAGFLALILLHLVVGVSEYRRVMNRPWPKVKPLGDDDW